MRIVFENNHDPDNGKFKDVIVLDDAAHLIYVYDCCGTYTTLPPGDKNNTKAVDDLDEVIFIHGLNKYPAITIIGEDGREVTAEVTHDSVNQVTVNFSEPFTGTIVAN